MYKEACWNMLGCHIKEGNHSESGVFLWKRTQRKPERDPMTQLEAGAAEQHA